MEEPCPPLDLQNMQLALVSSFSFSCVLPAEKGLAHLPNVQLQCYSDCATLFHTFFSVFIFPSQVNSRSTLLVWRRVCYHWLFAKPKQLNELWNILHYI